MAINKKNERKDREPSSIFEVRDLRKWYPVRSESLFASLFRETDYLKAVDDISFDIREGEVLGLVGQSGCGKSTLGELLLQLQRPTGGEILFKGEDVSEYDKRQMKQFRRDCQIIFQDPYESLNPRIPVARAVSEPLKIHGIGDREKRDSLTIEALEDAGLSPAGQYLDSLPSELSGGERQRVGIARALVLDPDFIVADEPVSMLDVSKRVSILNLFQDLQEKRDFTMLYISHNLGTINYISDRLMVMYLGNIVEVGPAEDVIRNPSHPYMETLKDAVPRMEPDGFRNGGESQGEAPDPINLPQGCRFRPYCEYASRQCEASEPALTPLGEEESREAELRRSVACYHPVDE